MIYSSWYHWHVSGFPVIFIAVRMAAGNHNFFTIRTNLLGEKIQYVQTIQISCYSMYTFFSKINNLACAPSEHPDNLKYQSSLVRVFALLSVDIILI